MRSHVEGIRCIFSGMSSPAPGVAPTGSARSVTDLSLDQVAGVRRFIAVLLLVDLAFGAAYGLDFAMGTTWHTVAPAIDLDAEANVATWYASSQWSLAGLLFLVVILPRVDRRRISTYALLLLPVACFYCSMDEAAQLHEGFGIRADRVFLPGGREASALQHTGVWVVLLVPMAALLAAAAIRALGREFGMRPGVRMAALGWAGVLLAGGGAELVSNLTWKAAESNMIQVLIEETGENLAVTLLCWAALDLIAASGLRFVWRATPAAKPERASS